MSALTEQVSSSIDALTQEFHIITNNLANVSTAGYKRMCNAFSRSLEARQTGEEEYSPGTIDLNSAFDFSQGGIVETGRPMDVALYGRGFFVIETPDGPRFTRNGLFQINSNGQVVNSDGHLVAGESGPISIPSGVSPSQLNISGEGSISASGAVIGKFRLVDFQDNENKLVPVGSNCFVMPDETVDPVTAEHVVVKQGYQEASNVKMMDELVDMIMVTRLYEANMKLLAANSEASDSIMSVAMG
jgi:flagellar basal body rod protein FlgG